MHDLLLSWHEKHYNEFEFVVTTVCRENYRYDVIANII